MRQVKLGDSSALCAHILTDRDETTDTYNYRNAASVMAGILRILTPVECAAIKEAAGFQFRPFWEADPRIRDLVPDDQRGMASMAGGLYCHEHRVLVIPLKHPLVERVTTMIVVPNIDLPSVLSAAPEPEPEKPNPRIKQW